MEERRPAEAFPPGDIIREELDARGWTQADLADILGTSISHINEVLNARAGVTAETAKGLAEAFGTSAEVWLNLEARYRLYSAEPRPGTGLRSAIYSKAPVRDLIKRHWIEGSTNPDVLAQTVCRFLGIDSLDEEPKPLGHAAKKSTSYDETSPAQVSWLCRVAELAPAAPVSRRYEPARWPELMDTLRALATNVPDVRYVPKALADFGIRFMIVEDLPGSKIDGVTVWLDESPVIALSLRYGKLHNFWHVLFHELSHVKRRDGQSEPIIDVDTDIQQSTRLSDSERSANQFAVEALIPPNELDSFVRRIGPMYSLRRIQGFASRIGVHPAIVIGQLAYRGEVQWSRFGTHLPTIREYVTGTALTDGWGHTLPAFSGGS
jgi:HTH-type transcriptional regulator/antitoxin HigA